MLFALASQSHSEENYKMQHRYDCLHSDALERDYELEREEELLLELLLMILMLMLMDCLAGG